jgi:hypothetical protein
MSAFHLVPALVLMRVLILMKRYCSWVFWMVWTGDGADDGDMILPPVVEAEEAYRYAAKWHMAKQHQR